MVEIHATCLTFTQESEVQAPLTLQPVWHGNLFLTTDSSSKEMNRLKLPVNLSVTLTHL